MSKLPTKFEMPLDRIVGDGRVVQFKARIGGFFFGKGGKPAFSVTSVAIDGMPSADPNSFSSKEITQIEKHALEVEYKKIVGG
ncbi:MAG: hypothetical protein ACKVRP_09955 [Bacteroidota bacterium]